ncbi:hypothetical protein OAO87_00605 [bacterium]|nr:hypothetical protein [bacterium]
MEEQGPVQLDVRGGEATFRGGFIERRQQLLGTHVISEHLKRPIAENALDGANDRRLGTVGRFFAVQEVVFTLDFVAKRDH